MPPLPPAAVAVDQSNLLEQVQNLLLISPALAFQKSTQFIEPMLQNRMRRATFLATAASQPREAAALLAEVKDGRWFAALPFAQALDVAFYTVAAQPRLAQQMLTLSAAGHPDAALREVLQYVELPYGAAIWKAAADQAPEQAVALAEGRSALAEETRRLLSRHPVTPLFALDSPADPAVFARVADASRGATYAPRLLLALRQNKVDAAALRPRDVALLAQLAVTEEERETALALARRLPLASEDLRRASPGALRAMLAMLAESGVAIQPAKDLVELVQTGVAEADDPVVEAMRLASILGPPKGPEARFYSDDRTLSMAAMFPDGLCLQRYFFHNDDDGVESFESFVASYAGDPAWRMERFPDYVHVVSVSAAPRRIEIYANIPVDLQAPANFARAAEVSGRHDVVTRVLAERKRKPTMIVHRGHDHHFLKTRQYLHAEAALVYLGSCRGLGNVEDVITHCRRAQLIATRGIGATNVNDPLLKALNTRLLSAGETLDWRQFWQSLPPGVRANEHFADYLPPYKNEAARFLAAWYRYATSLR